MMRQTDSETGQDLMEYALVLPLFLLLVLGVIEFSLLFYQYNVVANAAREGARSGIVMESDSCSTTCLKARINSAARGITVGLEPAKLTVASQLGTTPSAYGVAQVTVTVTYQAHFLTKTLIQAVGGKGDVTLKSTAIMQREY